MGSPDGHDWRDSCGSDLEETLDDIVEILETAAVGMPDKDIPGRLIELMTLLRIGEEDEFINTLLKTAPVDLRILLKISLTTLVGVFSQVERDQGKYPGALTQELALDFNALTEPW